MWWNGRRDGLKIRWWRHRVGSSPTTGTNKKRTSKRMSSFYWRLFDLLCKSPACSGSYWKAGETGDTPPVAEEVSLFRGSGAVCGFQKATNSNAATVFTRPRFPLQIFLSLRAAEDFISFLGHIRQSKSDVRLDVLFLFGVGFRFALWRIAYGERGKSQPSNRKHIKKLCFCGFPVALLWWLVLK